MPRGVKVKLWAGTWIDLHLMNEFRKANESGDYVRLHSIIGMQMYMWRVRKQMWYEPSWIEHLKETGDERLLPKDWRKSGLA